MEKFNLNGIWEFKDVEDKKSMKGYVPGEVHIDLLKNGIIKDPFFGKNIEDLRKYEGKRWVYWKEFFPDKNLIERCKKIELVFEGIDNHSVIYLNGKKIGETKNSFIPFSFDITEIIEEKNKIEIFIDDGYSLVPDKIPEKYLSFREKGKEKFLEEFF
jgi:Beta-galactosidase/beta-glucuronidase